MRLYEHERIQSSCHLALSLSLAYACTRDPEGGEKERRKEEGERKGGSKAKAIINIIIIIITIIIVIGFVLCAISLYLMELMV